jgi:hypothetical protein
VNRVRKFVYYTATIRLCVLYTRVLLEPVTCSSSNVTIRLCFIIEVMQQVGLD